MVALLPGNPHELLVLDSEEDCPYLRGQRARLPMRMPIRPLKAEETDARFAEGSRRHGVFLYRPTCSRCQACEAIRVDVDRFVPGRTHRRILRRNDALFRVEVGRPAVCSTRLELYEKHRYGRDLVGELRPRITARIYRDFLVESCVDSYEVRLILQGTLIGVSIVDRAARSLSAVYCYFDPQHERLSPGTYAILKEIELCRRWDLQHLYLGLYIAENRHMSYKGRFVPHERLVDGKWRSHHELPPVPREG